VSADALRLGRVGAALVLLLVIAAGVGSDVRGGTSTLPRWLAVIALAVAVAAALGGMLFVVWASGYAAFAGTSLRGKAQVVAGVVVAVLIGSFLLVVLPRLGTGKPLFFSGRGKRCIDGGFFWQHFPNRRAELFQDDSGRFCWPSGGGGAAGAAGGGGGDIPGGLVAAAGGIVTLLVLLAAAAAIVARRSRRVAEATVEDEDPVVQALDESLEDLRRVRDVRRAIVACYARMERALAGSGRGRRAHETPLEFLRRVLERVGREPGFVLTELFERARFSVEPMGESEKRSAIAALEQLRGRVAG
jgi:hypothetical protein